MMKKNLASLHNFRSYFFPLGEINRSFSNLLTRAEVSESLFYTPRLYHLGKTASRRQKTADLLSAISAENFCTTGGCSWSNPTSREDSSTTATESSATI